MVAGPGFEPRTEAYETSEMPFLYPAITVVGVQGFEPWTPWSQTRCASQTAPHSEYFIINGAGQENRTPNRRLEICCFTIKLVPHIE